MKAGWETVRLRDLCAIARGGSPRPIKQFITDEANGINWIKIGDTEQGGRYIDSTEERIKPEGVARSRYVKAGSFLLSNSMSFGRPYILRTDGCIHDGWLVLEPDYGRVDQGFLYHVLGSRTVFDQFDTLAAGSTVRNLNIGLVEGVTIPLPPLEEQQRIVAILDEAFEGLARARTHAEANLQNARELFERYLADQFLSGGFERKACAIGSLITLQRGFDITKKDQVEGQFPVVSSGGIKSYHSQAMAKAPGVVIGRKGSIGSVYFIESDYWPHDTTLWVKDFKGNDARLVYYLLRGIKLIELDTGAANPSLNRNLVHPIEVSWPTGDDQANVAAKMVSVETRSLEIQDRYQSKLQSLDALRQSLLQKAFAGELT